MESGVCRISTLLSIFQEVTLGTFCKTIFKQKSIQEKTSLCGKIKKPSVCVCVCVCVTEREGERERDSRHRFQQRQLLAIGCGI